MTHVTEWQICTETENFKNMASNISNERVGRHPSYEPAKIAEIW